MTQIDQLLLTRKETAAVLGLSVRSIDYMIAAGEMSPVRFGKRLMLKRKEVERLAVRGIRRRTVRVSSSGEVKDGDGDSAGQAESR